MVTYLPQVSTGVRWPTRLGSFLKQRSADFSGLTAHLLLTLTHPSRVTGYSRKWLGTQAPSIFVPPSNHGLQVHHLREKECGSMSEMWWPGHEHASAAGPRSRTGVGRSVHSVPLVPVKDCGTPGGLAQMLRHLDVFPMHRTDQSPKRSQPGSHQLLHPIRQPRPLGNPAPSGLLGRSWGCSPQTGEAPSLGSSPLLRAQGQDSHSEHCQSEERGTRSRWPVSIPGLRASTFRPLSVAWGTPGQALVLPSGRSPRSGFLKPLYPPSWDFFLFSFAPLCNWVSGSFLL